MVLQTDVFKVIVSKSGEAMANECNKNENIMVGIA